MVMKCLIVCCAHSHAQDDVAAGNKCRLLTVLCADELRLCACIRRMVGILYCTYLVAFLLEADFFHSIVASLVV